MYGRKKIHNTNAKWLQDVRNRGNFSKQEPTTITIAGIQQRFKNMKSWTALGQDMIYTYWIKKLAAIYKRLAVQISQMLVASSHSDWLTQRRMCY